MTSGREDRAFTLPTLIDFMQWCKAGKCLAAHVNVTEVTPSDRRKALLRLIEEMPPDAGLKMTVVSSQMVFYRELASPAVSHPKVTLITVGCLDMGI